jgi:DNA-binding transcriptional ArsR family regulator
MDAMTQALADPIRREILRMLRDEPRNAGAIAGAFAVSRPAVSRHLRVLREAGLVQRESFGRERRYRRTLDPLVELQGFLAELLGPSAWDRRLMALETEVQRVKRRRRRSPVATPRGSEEKETA